MSYLIVLDTNIIFNDFFFKSSDMKKLLKFTRHEPVDLCITRFNYYEILKKYKDELRPLVKKVKSTKSDLIRLEASELIDFENLKADMFAEKYKGIFDNIIEESNIKIIDFPTSQDVMEKISFKYFNNKKPFDENKVSFQDAIIWESIVEYCKGNEPDKIAFISNNHKDFANRDKDSIHEDLAGDIQNLSYYNSLSAFLENEEDNLRDYFNDYYDYDEELLLDDLKSFCERNDFLQNTIDDMLMNSDFEGEYFSGWGTDGYIEGYSISLNEVSLDIEDNAMLISFDIEVDVSFSIETIDPSYEKGDSGDGMMSESSSTQIWINSDITYLLNSKELVDYVELDRGFF
ncbi:PIN domain-containing protein [Bacillus nitratireducens]|uniref:PIN domain-containing protein n=1 Tax=Bacillus cereus group TaxID=86661 RepID=UPI001F5AB23A|nr:PIN domain-containing protein [Bacillus nitratireducens]UNP78014.1 PIN domain-containing protein [Bacillus nitratireducens]